MTVKEFKNLDKDEILDLLGLGGGTGVLGTIGLIAIGAAAGVSAALLLTPKTGRELRETLSEKARRTADDLINAACTTVKKTSEAKGEEK